MEKPRRKRGKRAGKAVRAAELRDIHSTLDGRPAATHSNHAHSQSTAGNAAQIIDRSVYYPGAFEDGKVETEETHIVPRNSLTRKQMLNIMPQVREVEPMVSRQLDKQSGKMVTVTDDRTVWRSDKSLLREANPFSYPSDFKREGSVSVGLNKRKVIVSNGYGKTEADHAKEGKLIRTVKTDAGLFPKK